MEFDIILAVILLVSIVLIKLATKPVAGSGVPRKVEVVDQVNEYYRFDRD